MKTKPSLKYQTISPRLGDGDDRFELRVVVETPRGSRHKYALDAELGAFVLKQTLASGLSWPYEYGFVPGTLGKDGDPLDVIVLMDEATFPGCVLNVRLLGVICMEEDGIENDRFVTCLLPREETSLSTDGYEDLGDLPKKLLKEIADFLKEYSEEKGHAIKMGDTLPRGKARKRILAGEEAYEKASAAG